MSDTYTVRIPMGDWSDDGHGKVQNYDFEVSKEFTKEILSENYLRNKKAIGFGLADFAKDYQDGTISKTQWDMLIAAGFDCDWETEYMLGTDGDKLFLEFDDMFEITMFFLGNGLEGFKYELIAEPDFYLFGRWSGPESGIGYGLFE